MRQWMRERMRRRGKRGPNDSESTGKIGQEIPLNQPAPLQPAYPENPRGGNSEAVEAAEEGHESPIESAGETSASRSGDAASAGAADGIREEAQQPTAESDAAEGRLVVETQPESPSLPPPEPAAASSKDPK
jgi:hypothetical protein